MEKDKPKVRICQRFSAGLGRWRGALTSLWTHPALRKDGCIQYFAEGGYHSPSTSGMEWLPQTLPLSSSALPRATPGSLLPCKHFSPYKLRNWYSYVLLSLWWLCKYDEPPKISWSWQWANWYKTSPMQLLKLQTEDKATESTTKGHITMWGHLVQLPLTGLSFNCP